MGRSLQNHKRMTETMFTSSNTPSCGKEAMEKNHINLEKINLKRLKFEKHLCQNPNLQIFSWWSPKENDTHPSPGGDQ